MKQIIVKFPCNCAETGAKLSKGIKAMYNIYTKKVYSMESTTAKQHQDAETKSLSDHIVAQEDAYFDNFCHSNNI